jgi:hypothetical protein
MEGVTGPGVRGKWQVQCTTKRGNIPDCLEETSRSMAHSMADLAADDITTPEQLLHLGVHGVIADGSVGGPAFKQYPLEPERGEEM